MTTVAELQTVLALRPPTADVTFEPVFPKLDETHPDCIGTGFLGRNRDDACAGTGLISSAVEVTRAAAFVVLRAIVTSVEAEAIPE